ncbi:MAG: hypothetical protein V8R48_02730 [Eggerthella lenta]
MVQEVGDAISEPHSSNDRVGHVIRTGPDALSARETAEKALSMDRRSAFLKRDVPYV